MDNFFNQNNVNQKTSVTNTLQEFFNETFGEVRGTVINGKPYVAGNDIAKCLAYSDTNQAIRQHISEQNKGTVKLTGPGGLQNMIVINEAGINELIFSSKMPKAKELQQWIFSDVMPKLKQYGMYFDHPILQQYGKNPEEAIKNIETVIIRQREENQNLKNTIDEQQSTIKNQQNRINELVPKENIYDHLIDSQGFNNTTSIAADFDMDVTEFNNLLENFGIQLRRLGTPKWALSPEYEGRGYTVIKDGYGVTGEGYNKRYYHFYFMAWTNKGREFLYDFLISHGYYPKSYIERHKPANDIKRYDSCPFRFIY